MFLAHLSCGTYCDGCVCIRITKSKTGKTEKVRVEDKRSLIRYLDECACLGTVILVQIDDVSSVVLDFEINAGLRSVRAIQVIRP